MRYAYNRAIGLGLLQIQFNAPSEIEKCSSRAGVKLRVRKDQFGIAAVFPIGLRREFAAEFVESDIAVEPGRFGAIRRRNLFLARIGTSAGVARKAGTKEINVFPGAVMEVA
jgi:hypothetical protein